MKKLRTLLILSILFGQSFHALGQGSLAQDRQALIDLYTNNKGIIWNIQWDFNTPVNTWQGVTVNPSINRVTGLDLSSNNLRGSFPIGNSLLQIDQLFTLNLADNFISNTNLSSIQTSLRTIRVDSNYLSISEIQIIRDVFSNSSVVDQPQKAFGPDVRVRVAEGDSLLVTVEPDNSGSTYIWKNSPGNLVPGATRNVLRIAQVDSSHAGTYTVQLLSPPTGQNFQFIKDVNVIITVDKSGISYESARDSTGKLRAIFYLPRDSSNRAYIKDTLLPSLGIVPIGSEACLCDEYSMYHFPDTLLGSDGTVNVGPQSLINSACEEVDPEGGDFGYDYAIDSLRLPFSGVPLNIQLDTTLNMSGLDTVTVAIVDMGIDSTHHALKDYLSGDNSKITCMNDSMGYNFYADSENPFDVKSSHGTHVAGIITSFLPDLPIKIMSVQVGKSGHDSRLFDMVCGIRYSILMEVDLINLSMGYAGPESNLLKKVIEDLQFSSANTRLITSAGNDTLDLAKTPSWPASYSESFPAFVVTVGAMDKAYDSLASFSNYTDQFVGIAAPGTKIYSTINGGDYGFMDGTSMAAPFVTSVLAYMKANHDLVLGKGATKLIQNSPYAMDDIDLSGLIKNNKKLKLSIDNCIDIPFARDDFFSTPNGQRLNFDPRRNDCPATGLIPNLLTTVDPSDGELVVNTDGTMTLKPTSTDKELSFTYELCSIGDTCNTATVTIVVGEANGNIPYWFWIIMILILLFIGAYYLLRSNT